MENRGTVAEFNDLFNQDHKIFWHRTYALVCTGFAFLLCLFAAGARAKDPDEGVMWKLGAMILAVGIAFTGHEGGALTHGKGLYKDLNKIIQSVIPIEDMFGAAEDGDDNQAEPEEDNSTGSNDPPEEDNSNVGETSSEENNTTTTPQ